MWQSSYNGNNCLYLVPTPIGNMEDMTYRAVEILKKSDVIFSEDTRVTTNLFNYFGIKKKLVSLHEHNESIVKEKVVSYLKDGCCVSLVTDRGTPIISDPGYKTVSYVAKLGYNVVALPGATAFVPAVVNSGISSNHFLFYGFLDSKENKRRSELEKLKNFLYPMVFYEAPHRIERTLNSMYEIFGDRIISISREISKIHESIYRGLLSELLNNMGTIKGEYVIVVEGYREIPEVFDSINSEIDKYISDGLNTMDAIKKVAKNHKITKSDVYKEYHSRREKWN